MGCCGINSTSNVEYLYEVKLIHCIALQVLLIPAIHAITLILLTVRVVLQNT